MSFDAPVKTSSNHDSVADPAAKVLAENNPWTKPPVSPQTSNTDSDDDNAGRRSIVTGNGFGYAVLSPVGDVSKFYAHPYRFERAGATPSDEGVPTLNYVEKMVWEQPLPHKSPIKTEYVQQSNIMRVSADNSSQLYFMPYGLKRNALITTSENSGPAAPPAHFKAEWAKDVAKEEHLKIGGRDVDLISFKGRAESIAMVPLDLKKSSGGVPANESGWAVISVESRKQLPAAIADLSGWQKGLTPAELVKRELKSQEDWRVKPDVTFQSEAEKRVWRQSESILRMGQIREQNTDSRKNNGLINASLPEGEWFIPWVRDMSYSINALTQMGHTDEARKGLMAYFNAGPTKMQSETRGKDYQISVVRYFGNGSEEADYSGEKTPNVELDNWGLVLWTASEYYKKTHDRSFLDEKTAHGTVYQSMRDRIVEPLIANLDKQGDGKIVAADSSLWEEHQENKKHFAFATIVAIRGLRGFLPMAEAMHDKAEVEKVKQTIGDLEKGFSDAFIDNKALRGTLEKSFAHDSDGALLEAFNMDVVKDPVVLENTLKKMELLREPSGGYRRVRGETNYEKQEFLMIDFYLARLYFKLGREKEGMAVLDSMVKSADQDKDRVPEMYVSEKNDEFTGPIGTPTGALPMVGYGAGAYVQTLEEREAARRERGK